MNEGFDHLTVVVTDLDEARRFFGLLGFVERVAVVVSGETMERYMGIADWEADHVTLVLEGAPVHQEVQLLHFHRPAVVVDDGGGLARPHRLQPRVLPGDRPRRAAGPLCRGRRSPHATRSWSSTTGGSSSSTDRAWWSSWPSGRRAGPGRVVT